MTDYRRAAAAAAAVITSLLIANLPTQAQDNYPSRPIRMIVPFAAGGPTDIVGRVMGAKMSEILG